MMTIGEFLKRRRVELNISQSDLVARLNLRGISLTKAALGHWETDRNLPPLENVEFRNALALALEMDVNRMMAAVGYLQSAENAHTKEAVIAMNIIDRLPEAARELALDYLGVLEKRYAEKA